MKNIQPRFSIYAALLHLYPTPYRERYGEEIMQTTADMLNETTSPMSRLLVWAGIAADLPINVGKQQLSYIGGVMAHETPKYLKRNSLLASVLLLPFIVSLLANGISKVVSSHDLYHSWLWQTSAIRVWLVYLPLVALLLSLGTYAIYATRSEDMAHRSRITRAFDVKHIWPLLIPILLASGIVLLAAFHDSARCWTRNPGYSATHVQQVWHCTTQNQSLAVFRHA